MWVVLGAGVSMLGMCMQVLVCEHEVIIADVVVVIIITSIIIIIRKPRLEHRLTNPIRVVRSLTTDSHF